MTSKGQTVVPNALRDRFNIKTGATLDWQEDDQSLRVIKFEPRTAGSFLEGLRRLGRVPAGPRTVLKKKRGLWVVSTGGKQFNPAEAVRASFICKPPAGGAPHAS
jgi:bifunctional DNA-binding transcriptional regulator/antitoxin component of YhaV-PrlF toxin-antitoxin module